MLLRKFLPYQLNVKKVSKAVNMQQKESILYKSDKVKFTPYQHLNFNYTETAPNLPKNKQGIIGKLCLVCKIAGCLFSVQNAYLIRGRGGGESLYERGGDARRKFELNP